jgi:hypothetical protein
MTSAISQTGNYSGNLLAAWKVRWRFKSLTNSGRAAFGNNDVCRGPVNVDVIMLGVRSTLRDKYEAFFLELTWN